jgi:hypothetical protein
VHNARNVFHSFRQLLSVIKSDHACWQTESISQLGKRVFVPARKNNIKSFSHREFSREATRIAISSV